ncbi:head-tail adaptor protein [Defluviimonas sp. WL0002]|uniref:Head-tail adaptor protein n=1 Tax=Albidovulum marisflavi TaxID=2984159 RepID=A0ABT2ZBU4_9RHOB|nr:head-tail adaptor protein [Defluviimonas sp. WL0002]MCV2868532.1 head-tail adaptor protein [Defluviimonas sp. WL0002]
MRNVQLNRRLVLEEAAREPDGAGGYETSWQEKGVLWAAIDVVSGRERAGEFVTVSTVSYRITVRAAPFGTARRPKPEQRLREGTRVFRITAVAEDGPGGRYLTCFALEEVLS